MRQGMSVHEMWDELGNPIKVDSIDRAIQCVTNAKFRLNEVTINHNIDTSRLVPDDQDRVELLMREGKVCKHDATSHLISAGLALDDLNAVKHQLEKDYSPNYIETCPTQNPGVHPDCCYPDDTIPEDGIPMLYPTCNAGKRHITLERADKCNTNPKYRETIGHHQSAQQDDCPRHKAGCMVCLHLL